MNVYGIGGVTQGLMLPQHEPARRAETERSTAAAARRPAGPASAPGLLRPAAPSLAAEAPSGTDPELWSVLSADERAFFAGVGPLGPLTYSHTIHSGQPTTAVTRGGRIDVRA